ncbi:hypothetical protein [Sphingomonas radiodurans]|uniref:hypothetical protein n=1 Tax=Sphingomonas radiodurans TaxID=2890321 RepID=UPI001E61AAB5|nr:hypothetical protein [Sphingomonas radiodurans]WBH16961.1 hypothetical protein LLW23_02235 [Sphingomonas radiodurans]
MTMFALAAALAFGAASPEPAAAPAPIAPVAERLASSSIDPNTDQRRVCVIDKYTGSLMPTKACQTRAQWVAQGTDPLAAR